MLKVLFYNDNTWPLSFLAPLFVCRDIRMTHIHTTYFTNSLIGLFRGK